MSGIGTGGGGRYSRNAQLENYQENHYRRQTMRNDRTDNDGSTEPSQYSRADMQMNYQY